MCQHIAKVTSISFFYLRRHRKTGKIIVLDKDNRNHLCTVLSFWHESIDYCNALYAELLNSTLAPLQRVLHTCCSFCRLSLTTRPRHQQLWWHYTGCLPVYASTYHIQTMYPDHGVLWRTPYPDARSRVWTLDIGHSTWRTRWCQCHNSPTGLTFVQFKGGNSIHRAYTLSSDRDRFLSQLHRRDQLPADILVSWLHHLHPQDTLRPICLWLGSTYCCQIVLLTSSHYSVGFYCNLYARC